LAKKKKAAALEQEVTIKNRLGLHARPAALFVQLANKFKSDISVIKDKEEVNGKSIMGIMMLAAGQGTVLKIRADGADAEAALKAIVSLVETNFGEVEI
jgi:phosphocarrier protein